MLIWINGELTDSSHATVSALDHGLTVGDGAFETAKVVDGVPFALERHLTRLQQSATGLGLPAPDRALVRKACTDVIGALERSDLARLRITYTGGIAPMGSERGDAEPTLIVGGTPVQPYPPTASVAAVPWPRNERGALAGLKTTSYAENVVALARARERGGSEALMADTQGRLCEGTGSNVFVVVDGRVLTPSLASGCLAGITRDLVLEWTEAQEAELDFSVLDEADEIFLTSSVRDVQPVEAVIYDDRRHHVTAPGPKTDEIAAEFERRSAENPEP
ncbi:4-amino-4-deoxychorismate lyase [Actinobacteria bacterium YIM 96077]|uniref:4-amino-4-deoxychorismate lyase n=1 Tax=Phytoactinopolyspora halophila TaxID=1981511 RepID=A0A329QY99_9ACTN|nr:aminotransferase class IV [Phytoactinopolyspora halophila]AYY13371.1 4-amino-4-deoxychorismate lyase [Actinobacteria bacterium YIM 96077]RAW17394.1 4-amino-4-deoxychorismate lyase [Phytoactinopolyspora halophila]